MGSGTRSLQPGFGANPVVLTFSKQDAQSEASFRACYVITKRVGRQNTNFILLRKVNNLPRETYSAPEDSSGDSLLSSSKSSNSSYFRHNHLEKSSAHLLLGRSIR